MLLADRESYCTTFGMSAKLRDAVARFENFGKPKLSIELVPKSSHFENLRNHVKPAIWTRLRKAVAEKAGHVCEICGGRGTRCAVACHERWLYDDARRIQKLEGLIALCPDCHAVKHIGRQIVLGFGDEAKAHLAFVNGWDEEQAEAYVDAAGELWLERSRHSWKLDLSWSVERGLVIERHATSS